MSLREQRLRALFEHASAAIFFIDREGRFVDANPAAAALVGISRDEILVRRADDLLARIGKEETRDGEWTVLRPDGTTREAEYHSVADIVPGVHLLVAHDVTGRIRAEKSLRHLSARLLQLQDEERSRIARQLHDTTAQNLAAVRLHLVRIKQSAVATEPAVGKAFEESLALTEQSIAEVRTLSYLLHPPMIEQAGLLPSLRWLVRGFEERSGIATTFDAPEELARLPRDVETAVFRIVQEALTNVQRHSGSAQARVAIAEENERLRVIIEDYGRGLPPELRDNPIALRSAGVGMAGIEERARELGGTMHVASCEHGTTVEVMLPVAEE